MLLFLQTSYLDILSKLTARRSSKISFLHDLRHVFPHIGYRQHFTFEGLHFSSDHIIITQRTEPPQHIAQTHTQLTIYHLSPSKCKADICYNQNTYMCSLMLLWIIVCGFCEPYEVGHEK